MRLRSWFRMFPEGGVWLGRRVLPAVSRELVVGAGVGLAAGYLFERLAHAVHRGHLTDVDTRALDRLAEWRSPERTRLMLALTDLGSYRWLQGVMAGVLVGMYRRRRGPLQMAVVLANGAGAFALAAVFKRVYRRERPPLDTRLVHERYYSFPSGHAMTSLCVYGMAAYLVGQRGVPVRVRVAVLGASGVLVLSIGFSRVYLGAHYPTDVAAGYLAGVPWLASGVAAVKTLRRLRVLATAPPHVRRAPWLSRAPGLLPTRPGWAGGAPPRSPGPRGGIAAFWQRIRARAGR